MRKNICIAFILTFIVALPCAAIGASINNGVFSLNESWSWNYTFSLRGQFDESGEKATIAISADTISYSCDFEKRNLSVTKGNGNSWSGSGVTFDISDEGEVTNFTYQYTGSSTCTRNCKLTTPSMKVNNAICMTPINLLLQ